MNSEDGVVTLQLSQGGSWSQKWGRDGKKRTNSRDIAELERTALGDQLLGDRVGGDNGGIHLPDGVSGRVTQGREPRRSYWSEE